MGESRVNSAGASKGVEHRPKRRTREVTGNLEKILRIRVIKAILSYLRNYFIGKILHFLVVLQHYWIIGYKLHSVLLCHDQCPKLGGGWGGGGLCGDGHEFLFPGRTGQY